MTYEVSMRGFVVLIALFVFSGGTVMAADEPAHTVLLRDGDLEIREYGSMIVAEVEVRGDREQAGSLGFRPLADYIFGNNAPRQSIEMTAPVTTSRGQSIEMTAPVTSTASGENVWVVAFIMPAIWTMETLPRPNNPAVNIREIARRRMAVVKYRGRRTASTVDQNEAELREWMTANNFEPMGEAVHASFSPPWTPVPLRRHEIMIEVSAAQ